MKDIEKSIEHQCHGTEKDFLMDTIKNEAIYLAKGDKTSMQRLITRVNLLHGSLSENGKKLATQIMDKISEDMNSLWVLEWFRVITISRILRLKNLGIWRLSMLQQKANG